jgi:hypothetical protein
MGKGDWDVLRGDISNLLSALSATSKRPLEYLLPFLGGISPEASGPSVFLFTASAWPEQVLSGADRRDREGQVLEEEQVRREPAPQFPLEGVARTDEAPADRLEDGGLGIQVTIEDYEPRRNCVQGSSHLSQVAVNKWLTFKYKQIPRCGTRIAVRGKIVTACWHVWVFEMSH